MASTLVTGGTGFLGRSVVDILARRGHRVRVFSRSARSSNGARGDDEPGAREDMAGDITRPSDVVTAVGDVDHVFHLASDFRELESSEEESFAVNVEGTLNVLQAASEAGVQRIVHCSTVGVYGSVEEIPTTEEAPLDPDDIPYERNKTRAERVVREFAEHEEVEAVIVRPSSIYGPGDMRLLKLFSMIADERFVMFGPGNRYIDLVFVEDAARGIVDAGFEPGAAGEAFNLGGGDFVTVDELATLIAKLLDVRPPWLRLPLGPSLLAADLAERVFSLVGKTPPITRRRLGFFANNRAYSIAKAQEILGYRPETALREGLERTISWYQSNGFL